MLRNLLRFSGKPKVSNLLLNTKNTSEIEVNFERHKAEMIEESVHKMNWPFRESQRMKSSQDFSI